MLVFDLMMLFQKELLAKLSHLDKMVPRAVKFPAPEDKIKIAIGMRRSGKTIFLYQHMLDLIAKGVPKEAIFFANFEDDRLLPIDTAKLSSLIDTFYDLHPENQKRKCYLFLDKIQNVKDWPLIIRRLHDTKNVEIFLTGSSAKMLSKEISTSLRGRSLSTEIWPFSFDEYLLAKNVSSDSLQIRREYFETYLARGGFPEVTDYEEDSHRQTLQEYLDVAIYRDIIERHEVGSPEVVRQMILTLTHNAAKPFSINKFFNDMKSRGYRVSKESLYKYADYIEDAYLSFGVTLYSKSIRRVQSNPKKIYMIDPGLARAITLDYENDYGRLFENVVYLDLRRLGCRVEYYLDPIKHYEVDFLAHAPNGQKKLFQVAWHIDSAQTLDRETRALKSAQEELGLRGELITLESYLKYGVRF